MPMSEIHEGHRRRLRGRYAKGGLDGFEDHQVLELLLFYAIPRKDTNPLAHSLIKHFKTLDAVFDARPEDLMEIEGIGHNAALFLALFKQVFRRYKISKNNSERPQLLTTKEVASYIVPLMFGKVKELVYLLCLDTQCRVTSTTVIEQGTVKHATIHPRKVVDEAIRRNACSVVLAHNHPQGTAVASKADIAVTRKLRNLLEGIDIRLLDHIIVDGEGNTFSFALEGLFSENG